MRELARASGTSQALLHHHFGTKEQLYEAVKAHAVACFMTQQQDEEPLTEPDLGQGIQRYFTFCKDFPALNRLAMWDELQGEQRLWAGERQLYALVRARVQEAQAEGVIRKDLDPNVLLVVISAVGRSWVQSQARFGLLQDTDEATAVPDDFVDQVVELLIHGCQPRD